MHSTAHSPTPTTQWQDLSHAKPNLVQLDNMKAHLELALLALEALAGSGSQAMLQAATQLNLESKVPERVALWRQSQSNPLGSREEWLKKLNVEEARSLVLITCYLAKDHQELIRRAVALLEEVAQNNREPHQVALLGNYLDAFSNSYQERIEDGNNVSTEVLTQLAVKLVIDLLFCSGPSGHRRLWVALLDRSS